MHKVRLTYTKSREAIYIPAIDICEVFERALRRMNVKIGYKKGKTVKPDIVCANPLPIGIESICEICDILLEEHIETSYLVKELNRVLPNGVIVMAASYVNVDEGNISKRVYASIYELSIEYNDLELSGKNKKEIFEIKSWYINQMDEFLSGAVMLVLKKTKYRQERIDIKPYIINYDFAIDGKARVTVYTGKEKSLNPEYIMIGYMEYIGKEIEYSIRRTKILYYE